jgi:branched-chain amino acid transport system permease protein
MAPTINGAFYAMLSLGLAVIFGLLNIINFTHGAQYMMGAFCAYFLLQWAGVGYWWSLLIAPIVVGITGMIIERAMLARLYKLDHLYGLLLTFGLALIIQGVFTNSYGSSGLPYRIPDELTGGINLGFMFLPKYRGWVIIVSLVICLATWYVIERTMLSKLYKLDHLYGLLLTFGLALIIQGVFTNYYGSSGQPYRLPQEFVGTYNLGFMFLPKYRAWVIVASLIVCLATWFVIERTKLGSYLRAATENPALVQAFGINVPRMITLTYGFGVGLAALAGVMAAPIYQVSPQMGASLIIVVFAVVVIGGMGSIMGAILTGFGLGVIEGLTKVFYPEASNTVIFVIMVVVLLVKPAGLFGKER